MAYGDLISVDEENPIALIMHGSALCENCTTGVAKILIKKNH